VIGEGSRLFHEVLTDDAARLEFQRTLTAALWSRRDDTLALDAWLTALRAEIVEPHVAGARSLNDDLGLLDDFITRLGPEGDVEDLSLGEFAGIGTGLNRINLSTLHSSKGREFDVVILVGMEEGRLPRNNPSANDLREARRLFYVGFTRARHEIHLLYSKNIPSRFVTEVEERLANEAE
jgi:DNA helicase-2/ATP-dependent DNA helicase PcrA